MLEDCRPATSMRAASGSQDASRATAQVPEPFVGSVDRSCVSVLSSRKPCGATRSWSAPSLRQAVPHTWPQCIDPYIEVQQEQDPQPLDLPFALIGDSVRCNTVCFLDLASPDALQHIFDALLGAVNLAVLLQTFGKHLSTLTWFCSRMTRHGELLVFLAEYKGTIIPPLPPAHHASPRKFPKCYPAQLAEMN